VSSASSVQPPFQPTDNVHTFVKDGEDYGGLSFSRQTEEIVRPALHDAKAIDLLEYAVTLGERFRRTFKLTNIFQTLHFAPFRFGVARDVAQIGNGTPGEYI
jgi:hypothetical protein